MESAKKGGKKNQNKANEHEETPQKRSFSAKNQYCFIQLSGRVNNSAATDRKHLSSSALLNRSSVTKRAELDLSPLEGLHCRDAGFLFF